VTNNYVLRRLRYTFNFNDNKVIALFAQGDLAVTREEISGWLKKDDDPDYVRCTDNQFAHFLNGLIIEKRGAKDDGKKPKAEWALNNNIIFRKLKIAFNLIDQDILDLLNNAGLPLGKAELSAFFRKPDHRHYRECQDQVLRNFLQGLQMRESNTTPEQKQSQNMAVQNKQAQKKAKALKEKQAKEKAGIKDNVNPYAPKKDKVVYQNPKRQKAAEAETPEKTKRPTLSLNKSIWGKKSD
jgi:uncharacterized protein YehS (DUF1456 family)